MNFGDGGMVIRDWALSLGLGFLLREIWIWIQGFELYVGLGCGFVMEAGVWICFWFRVGWRIKMEWVQGSLDGRREGEREIKMLRGGVLVELGAPLGRV